MKPTILLKLPRHDVSFVGLFLTCASFFVIYGAVLGFLAEQRYWVLSLLPIPILTILVILYYFPRKLARINARYEAERSSLPRAGNWWVRCRSIGPLRVGRFIADERHAYARVRFRSNEPPRMGFFIELGKEPQDDWRVLCRSALGNGNAPIVRFVGYRGFPESGEHPWHNEQQWAPTLYEPNISTHGLPRVTTLVKIAVGGVMFAWCACWITRWLSPASGGPYGGFLRAVLLVMPIVIAASSMVWLAGLLVTTEVWLAPRLIRVKQSWAWRKRTVLMDFPVEPGFSATLWHGQPDEQVWFSRFPSVLRLANGSGSVELPTVGLCLDDFWWAVTSDYRTTPEEMDTFLAHGIR